jgi:hypothetical protein
MKSNNRGQGWFGDSAAHADVGQKGGNARKVQIESDPSQSYQHLGRKGGRAAQKSGSAHKLTSSDRARGGRNSHRGQANKETAV